MTMTRQIGLRMIKTTDAKDRTLSNRIRTFLKLSALMPAEFNTARSMILPMKAIKYDYYISKNVLQAVAQSETINLSSGHVQDNSCHAEATNQDKLQSRGKQDNLQRIRNTPLWKLQKQLRRATVEPNIYISKKAA